MAAPGGVVSLLVALEFVVTAAVVLLVVPLDVAAPLVPLLFVSLVAFHVYQS